ncbi:MAG: hypothetical protein HC828_18715, partial [Blastochloris sp.]|nr:hypothetical protein [Blastochloris sp.]
MADGFHPLDLLDLPEAPRSLLRLVLRHVQITYTDIRRAAYTLPELRHLAGVGLDAVLDDLVQRHYLTRLVVGGETAFRANMQRRYLRARNPDLLGISS